MKIKQFYKKYPPFSRITYRIMQHNMSEEILVYSVYKHANVLETAIIFRRKADGRLVGVRNGTIRPLHEVWKYIRGIEFERVNSPDSCKEIEKEINKTQFIKQL